MTPIIDTRKLKHLKASETRSKKWNLLYSYKDEKIYHKNLQFCYYDTFTSLDELKVFCDLYFPGVKLKVETFNEWLGYYYS